ncbi:MAG TPA: hypothetical protein VE422_50225 [Terriglobia bacterium]|nr:hypothetical protein [Terriglobia bacterium]
MNPNQESVTVSKVDQEVVMTALANIQEKLPFLIDLTPDGRKLLIKLGARNQEFVRKAVEVAVQNPKMLPVAFDIDRMRRNVQLFNDLSTIQLALDQLKKRIDDTAIQFGNDAYADARTVYTCAKSSFGRATLETAAGELGRRFTRKSRSVASASGSKAPPAGPPTPQS